MEFIDVSSFMDSECEFELMDVVDELKQWKSARMKAIDERL